MKHLIQSLIIAFVISQQLLASDDHVFVSEEHVFSVQYPKSWRRGEVVHPQTVIRVESPGGDDFNITVVQIPGLRAMSPGQYARGMLSRVESGLNIISRNYPGARLVEKGITQLSQQPAVFHTMDYTLSAAGREIRMRAYVISTKYGDKQYTLTFRTARRFFADYFPMIQRLALGFQLTKTKLK